MSYKKQDYVTQLQRMLQDVGEFLEPDDVNKFLGQALLIYSKDRPLIKLSEMTGDGSAFDFALPADWTQNVSYIISLEYPVRDTVQAQNFLDKNDYAIIRKLVTGETVLYLRFKNTIPASGEKARMEYVTIHTLNDATPAVNTIIDTDSEAVLAAACSLCYWALAARFAQTTDSTLEADVIDYQRKSEIYSDLAKEKMAFYKTIMGIGEEGKDVAAATAGVAVKELDMTYPGSLGDYLTHDSADR